MLFGGEEAPLSGPDFVLEDFLHFLQDGLKAHQLLPGRPLLRLLRRGRRVLVEDDVLRRLENAPITHRQLQTEHHAHFLQDRIHFDGGRGAGGGAGGGKGG